MQSINLIPQQEVQEQTQVKAVTFSTWLSIGILVIIGGIAGFNFYKAYNLKNEIAGIETEIGTLRQQITSVSAIEISARNLDKKYSTLKDVFQNRASYSMLTTEIAKRTPSGVFLDSMTLQKGAKVNLTGHADNYILIASFTNNLVNKEFSSGEPTLKKLFTAVTLNSVNLEKNRNIVRFSINVDLDANLLKKK